MNKKIFLCELKDYFKNRRLNIILLTIYTIFSLTAMIYLFIEGHIQNGLYVLLLTLVAPLVLLFECGLNIKIPLLLLFFLLIIPTGSTLGSSFEFYNKFIWFDDLLHTMSGFIFSFIGFVLTQFFVGKPNNARNFIGCLLGGFFFSLALGLIWELIEYGGTMLLNIDMQEDTIINDIRSFFLSGTHKESINIENISETTINYVNGETYTIEGYLDVGLYDTLNDMLVCFLGALAYMVVMIIGYIKIEYILRIFCPVIYKNIKNNMVE